MTLVSHNDISPDGPAAALDGDEWVSKAGIPGSWALFHWSQGSGLLVHWSQCPSVLSPLVSGS